VTASARPEKKDHGKGLSLSRKKDHGKRPVTLTGEWGCRRGRGRRKGKGEGGVWEGQGGGDKGVDGTDSAESESARQVGLQSEAEPR
jgi:hypothetical protein